MAREEFFNTVLDISFLGSGRYWDLPFSKAGL
jgi:hypothetical protein